MHPLQNLVKKLLPSMPAGNSPERRRQWRLNGKRKEAEREAKALEEKAKEAQDLQAEARSRAILTGEGLEVLGCEVCGMPLRFRTCMNPGCRHINPRPPEFIGVPNKIEGEKEGGLNHGKEEKEVCAGGRVCR